MFLKMFIIYLIFKIGMGTNVKVLVFRLFKFKKANNLAYYQIFRQKNKHIIQIQIFNSVFTIQTNLCPFRFQIENKRHLALVLDIY